MKRFTWREYISLEKLKIFENIYEEFFSDSIAWDSLFSISAYSKLLDRSLTKVAKDHLYSDKNILKARIAKRKIYLKKHREEIDYLFNLIPEWIHEELRKNSTFIRSRRSIFRRKKDKYFLNTTRYPVKRLALSISFQNILCMIAWKYTIIELVELATYGDDQSIFRLIQLNNRFIISKWFSERLIQAQRFKDKDFIKKLINAIKDDAQEKYLDSAKIGFAVIILWFLGFSKLPKRELLSYLQEKYGYPTYDLPSFNVLVNRLGLRKCKKV